MTILDKKITYPDIEWDLISSLPHLTCLLISCADYSGIEGTKEELKSGAKSIASGRLKYPDNQLITNIVPDGVSKEEVLEKVTAEQKKLIDNTHIYNENSLLEFQKASLKKYSSVMYYISKIETGLIVNQFKKWILNIAEETAVAAIENSVFAQKREAFSEKEVNMFEQIKRLIDKNNN